MEPIVVSANGRTFVQRGDPFFWLGDTAWELFRGFTLDDARDVVRRRKRQGFSVLQVMLNGVDDGHTPNPGGWDAWLGGDPFVPNEAYFAHVDAVVTVADREDMVLVVGLYHQWHGDRLNPGNARGYARWVSQRYRSCPNLVWCMYPRALPEYAAVCRELAAGLHEGDDGAHLIAVHPDPSPTSSSFLHQEPWLAFNMIQTCIAYEQIHEMVSADLARVPAKPVVMAEGGYEGVEFGRTQTPLEIRKQAYWSHLAGGHHTYGHQDSWIAPLAWREWVESDGARQMGVYRRTVTSLPRWWEWVPDQSIFVGTEGGGSELNVAARSAEGDWVLAYLASESQVTVRMDSIVQGDRVVAAWVDPTNGDETAIGTFAHEGARSFSPPPGWADAVLRLAAV